MALTTLENVKAWLSLKPEVAADDALLNRLIVAASAFLESWLNRTILSQQFTDTRNGNGKQVMLFTNYPVTDVTSVVIDEQPIPKAVGNGSGWFFDADRLYLRGYAFGRGMQNVKIAYSAGYASVPPDIEQACIDLVALRYREKSRIGEQSKSIGGETVSFFIGDLTPFAKSVLQQYKRVVYPS